MDVPKALGAVLQLVQFRGEPRLNPRLEGGKCPHRLLRLSVRHLTVTRWTATCLTVTTLTIARFGIPVDSAIPRRT